MGKNIDRYILLLKSVSENLKNVMFYDSTPQHLNLHRCWSLVESIACGNSPFFFVTTHCRHACALRTVECLTSRRLECILMADQKWEEIKGRFGTFIFIGCVQKLVDF